jgi:hypothetical protein
MMKTAVVAFALIGLAGFAAFRFRLETSQNPPREAPQAQYVPSRNAATPPSDGAKQRETQRGEAAPHAPVDPVQPAVVRAQTPAAPALVTTQKRPVQESVTSQEQPASPTTPTPTFHLNPQGEKVFVAEPAGIKAAMSEARTEIQECYDAWLSANPQLAGKLLVGFVVRKNERGEVGIHETTIKDATSGNVMMNGCVANVIQGLRFEPPANGELKVTYPFRFDPEKTRVE